MAIDTKDRLIHAMSTNMRQRGMHATGISDVLRDAGAPKGVLYHHFPGGKVDLTVAAIGVSVEQLTGSLQRALTTSPDPLDALDRWLTRSAAYLVESDYGQGCPLATVALETTPDDGAIREALDHGFAQLRDIIDQHLVAAGRAEPDSRRAAYAIVSCYEGGLLQARVSGDTGPMLDACRFLLNTLRAPA